MTASAPTAPAQATAQTPEAVADFADALRSLRNGDCLYDLNAALTELVMAVRATGKSGSLALKIEIKPDKGSVIQIFASDTITKKIPEQDKALTLFYTSEGGQLARDDPRQKQIFGNVRNVPEGDGVVLTAKVAGSEEVITMGQGGGTADPAKAGKADPATAAG